MGSIAFKLPPATMKTVHELRRTQTGIQSLREDGRFKEYHQTRLSKSRKAFLAWDGEGWTDNDLEHRYMLLQNSTGSYISAPQLGTIECLNFILKTGTENPNKIHVIFGGGYDVTHILRDLTEEQRTTLNEENKVEFSVPAMGNLPKNRYRIEYIPHKWFTVRGYSWRLRKYVTVKIFDVMTFFQTSFINALESRKIEVPEIIKSGKASRSDFTYSDIQEIIEYCNMELQMLVELCTTLRNEFDEAGIPVTQWHGPGAVATAAFKMHGVLEHKTEPPLHIEQILQRAYFGGRFEQFKAGHYDGKVYVYDINSAYPDKIRNLPSLAGATWKRVSTYSGNPGVYLASYHDQSGISGAAYPLPWRARNGNVAFPAHNKAVWVWHFEAEHATSIEYGYELVTGSDIKPFSWVAEAYDLRKKWKAEGRGGERALKLMLNSLYGKTAQRIGGTPDKNGGRPPWHQLEWAGMITSATRAQIWEAVSQAPDKIIAVETDSVASMVPLDLDIGDDLGQWEYSEHDWMTYIQSGVYFASGGNGGAKVKSRGIDMRQLDYQKVIEFLNDQSEPLLVTNHEFIGMTNPRSKYMYGQWTSGTKEIKVGGGKRLHLESFCGACALGLRMGEHMHTMTATPTLGHVPSAAHPLPWLDEEKESQPEVAYVGEAVREWESTRHTAE